MRRNRRTAALRAILQETHLQPEQLIAPLFVHAFSSHPEPIPSMPEIFRLPLDFLEKEAEVLFKLGVRAVALFPAIDPSLKDQKGTASKDSNSLICQAIRRLKASLPDLCLIADIALDPYTDHGHDGILNSNGVIVNDSSVHALGEMALVLADAGVDVVAPSDMMDGRIGYIRSALDENGFTDVSILSYAAKYASAFYGPFRDALGSAPKSGDKKTYQLNPANRREALLESLLDIDEGADMLLVKPALPYLDILSDIKNNSQIPVGAYHVSGEYAMVMAAAEKGWLDADRIFAESLLSIKRAGAGFILTYAAKRVLKAGHI